MTDLGAEVVNYVSHATQQRLQNLLEKVSQVAQQKNVNLKVCLQLHCGQSHSNTTFSPWIIYLALTRFLQRNNTGAMTPKGL